MVDDGSLATEYMVANTLSRYCQMIQSMSCTHLHLPAHSFSYFSLPALIYGDGPIRRQAGGYVADSKAEANEGRHTPPCSSPLPCLPCFLPSGKNPNLSGLIARHNISPKGNGGINSSRKEGHPPGYGRESR